MDCALAAIEIGAIAAAASSAPPERPADATKSIADGAYPESTKAQKQPQKSADAAPPPPRDAREQRKLDAQARQQQAQKLRPLKNELEQIDRRLAELSQERAGLEERLTQPLPPAEIADCGRRLKAANDATAQLEERWLALSAQIEEAAALGA